ncbi:MAG: hypothetical protein QOD12_2540 [Verrucomicrobiota bacterium]|jgi:transcriptional regulator GlxA family with amidase domain
MSVIALHYVQRESLFRTWRLEPDEHAVPFERFRATLNGQPARTVRAEVATRKTIGFLGFAGVDALQLAGPLAAFATTRVPDEEFRAQIGYETVVIGVDKKTFVSQSGATFTAQYSARSAPDLDTVVIPGGAGLRDSPTGVAIVQWLKERAAGVRRIVAICGGIYPLARTGLLDRRRVATHWRLASDVAQTFPEVQVNFAASCLQDGRFYTCGSGTAPIEMALVLVAEDYGEEIALAVARELVVDFRPVSGVEYRTRSIAVPPRTEYRLASLPDWIATRLQQDLSVEVLAERARLCPRHFSRIFKQAFKVTPAEFVEWLRINEAARRLLAQDCAIEIVATAVGFKSSDAFRKAFIRVMGLTPSAFQRQHRRKTNGKVSSPRLRASA